MIKTAMLCVFFTGAVGGMSCAVLPPNSNVSGAGRDEAPSGAVALSAQEEAYGHFAAACMEMLDASSLDDDGKNSEADKAWRRAADDLEKAAVKDAKALEIRRALAGCYFRLGDAKKAGETIQSLAAIIPNTPQAHMEIADAWKTLNRNAAAVAEYQAAIRLTTPGADAWSSAVGALADFYRAMGQPTNAVPLYRQMAEQSPRDTTIQMQLGAALGDAGQHGEAIKIILPLLRAPAGLDAAASVRAAFFLAGEYQKAGRAAEGATVFAEFANSQPDSAEICQARMQLLDASGRIDDALALGVDFLRGHRDADAVRLVTAALQERTGRPERAMQLYREGISEGEPFRTIAARQMTLMCVRLAEQKQFDLALEGLQIVFSSPTLDDPIRAQALLQAAAVLRQKGQPEKAIELLTPLITVEERRNWRVGMLYVDFLRTQGQPAQALQYLEAMLDHHKKESDALEAIHFEMAIIYQTAGQTDFAKAEQHLRAALAINPSSAGAMNGLGYLYAEKEESLDEARKLIEGALAKMPAEPAFLDSLGWVQYKLALRDNNPGLLPQAIENLQQAAADPTPDAIVLSHLGDVLFVAGELEKAKESWQKALEIKVEPGGEEIDRALTVGKIEKVTRLLADELKQFGKPRKPGQRIRRPLAPPTPAGLTTI